jgi:hypothetical protein
MGAGIRMAGFLLPLAGFLAQRMVGYHVTQVVSILCSSRDAVLEQAQVPIPKSCNAKRPPPEFHQQQPELCTIYTMPLTGS